MSKIINEGHLGTREKKYFQQNTPPLLLNPAKPWSNLSGLLTFPHWSQEVWGVDVACSVLIISPICEKQARACVLVRGAMMQQDVPRCSGWASAGHPPLSPLLEVGQGGIRALEAKAEMERGRPANCSHTVEVATWEKARTAALNILPPCIASPHPPPPKNLVQLLRLTFGDKRTGGILKRKLQSSVANGM